MLACNRLPMFVHVWDVCVHLVGYMIHVQSMFFFEGRSRFWILLRVWTCRNVKTDWATTSCLLFSFRKALGHTCQRYSKMIFCEAKQNLHMFAAFSACFALRFTKVVAHQHLPIFHTEHCVFCRFLSNGNDYTDPGSCTYATLKVHMSKI